MTKAANSKERVNKKPQQTNKSDNHLIVILSPKSATTWAFSRFGFVKAMTIFES